MMARLARFALVLLLCCATVQSFSVPNPRLYQQRSSFSRERISLSSSSCLKRFAVSDRRMGELTKPEQVVYDILQDVSKSGLSFRVVVVGKGAILESTVPSLGPVVKVTQSPSTGANMLTVASSDQSFEFHVQLEQVCKVALVEKETPSKTLRIIRLLNDLGESMASLILVDSSDEALAWYRGMIERRGNEIQL